MTDDWCPKGQVYYHGTPRKDQVLENGLDPDAPPSHLTVEGGKPRNAVYLSEKKALAEGFGDLVEVCVDNPEKIEPDPEYGVEQEEDYFVMYPDKISSRNVREPTASPKGVPAVLNFDDCFIRPGGADNDFVICPVEDSHIEITAWGGSSKSIRTMMEFTEFTGSYGFGGVTRKDVYQHNYEDKMVSATEEAAEFINSKEFCRDVEQTFEKAQNKNYDLTCTGHLSAETIWDGAVKSELERKIRSEKHRIGSAKTRDNDVPAWSQID